MALKAYSDCAYGLRILENPKHVLGYIVPVMVP